MLSVSQDSCVPPSPVLMQLPDSAKRGDHSVRLSYQHKRLQTKVNDMKHTIDELQADVRRLNDKASSEAQKKEAAFGSMREMQANHREDRTSLRQQMQDEYERRLQRDVAKLQNAQAKQVDALTRQLETERADHTQARKRLCAEHSQQRQALRDEYATFKQEVEAKAQERVGLMASRVDAECAKVRAATHAEAAARETEWQCCEKELRNKHIRSVRRHGVEKRKWEKEKSSLKRQLRDAELQNEALVAELEGTRQAGPGRPSDPGYRSRYQKLSKRLHELQQRLHLRGMSLPNPEIDDDSRQCQVTRFWENVQFVTAALADRHPSVVAVALAKNQQISGLLQTKELQPAMKESIAAVLQRVQQHWGPRHAVILMQEIHSSRSEFDALRHLLSYKYDREKDMYQRISVWTNPWKENDVLYAPTLAARAPRERERESIFAKCGAGASEDGLYSGITEFEPQIAAYVEHYWTAIDAEVQDGRTPLMLVLTGDATGGWRGDAVTHGELGIGSWVKGKAQSRLTLLPLFLMEGDDSAENLRNKITKVADAYNKLKRRGNLTVKINGAPTDVRVKMLVAADFQFFKAAMNMSKYTSAIWCSCQLDNMFKWPGQPLDQWEQVHRVALALAYITTLMLVATTSCAQAEAYYASLKCELKDLATICMLNHYSVEVLEGRAFEPFCCPCGWTSGNEMEWRRTMEAHAQLEGEELRAAELEHSSNPIHCRHKPYHPPLFQQGTLDMSADVLHLLFINMFAFFMELTILVHIVQLDPPLREPCEVYLRHIGLPMKLVKAKTVTEMKQSLTGRDAKVVISAALQHVPELLQFAHAHEADVEAELQQPQSNVQDDDFTWDGDNDDVGLDEEAGEHDEDDSRSRFAHVVGCTGLGQVSGLVLCDAPF